MAQALCPCEERPRAVGLGLLVSDLMTRNQTRLGSRPAYLGLCQTPSLGGSAGKHWFPGGVGGGGPPHLGSLYSVCHFQIPKSDPRPTDSGAGEQPGNMNLHEHVIYV